MDPRGSDRSGSAPRRTAPERRGARRAGPASLYPIRVALVYALLVIAWILFSDRAVELVVPDRWERLAKSLKGTAFILGTSLFVFLGIRSTGRDRARAIQAEHETQERARQQAAVAELGELALRVGEDLDALFEAACRALSRTLRVGFAKVLQILPDAKDFRLVAGVGWAPGLVGTAIVPGGRGSQAGYTLGSRGPVVVVDLSSEERFSGPALLIDHGIVSGMSATIGDPEDPWGVLGAHVSERRAFSEDEVAFVTGVANILASAIRRVQAEGALRGAEARYRGLVEAIPATTFVEVAGLDQPSLYISPQIRDLLGLEPEEWIEGPPTLWRDLLHPEDAPHVLRLWDSCIEGKGDFDCEYRMVRPDGRTVWVREVSRVLPGANGDQDLIQGVFFDVTERKKAEAGLAVAEARYRSIVETTPAVTYQEEASMGHGAEGSSIYVSPQIERLLGHPAGVWADDRTSWAEIVHPGDREAVLAESKRTSRTGEPYLQEYRMVAADGRVVWVRDQALLVRDEEGQPLLWQGVIFDITETKEVEERLREAEDRYRSLVERTPGVEYIAEPGAMGTWHYVSPQIEALLGYPPGRWVDGSHLWFERIHEDDRARVVEAEESIGEIGERSVDEYRMIAADDRVVWVRDEAEVVRQDAGRPVLWGVLYDITESKQAEAEIRRFAARLEAVHDLDRAMLSAASTQELLEVALDRLQRLVPCDRAAVRLLDPEHEVLRVARAWQRDGVDLQIADEISVADPQSMALLQEELFVVWDMEELPEIPGVLRPLAEAGIRSGIGAIIRAEDRTLGYLTVMSSNPGRFDEAQVEIVREIATELAIGLRQSALREALRERAEQLQALADQRQALLGQVVAAQEQERRRVANELHDGLGQTLTAISLRVGAMELRAPPELKADVVGLRELATSAVADSRRIVWGLRPPDLDTLGFVGVLRGAAASLTSSGVEVEVRVGEEGVHLSSEEEPIVLLVLQEALNNAIRHAGATSIQVDVGSEGDAFVATVVDDGVGFDPTETRWGLGLISMRERAEVLGAKLEVSQRPEAGTIVRLRLAEVRDTGRLAGQA